MYKRQHLVSAKAQVEEEILQQQAQLEDLADRMETMIRKHRVKTAAKSDADVSAYEMGTLEERNVRAEVLKDVVQVRGGGQ